MKKIISFLLTLCLILTMVPVTAQVASAATTNSMKVTKSGVTYPTNLTKGNSFVLKGTIKSNKNIDRIEIGIVSGTTKNWVQGQKVIQYPKKKTYDILKNADSKIKFGKLFAGTYYYRCWVKNGNNRSIKVFDYKFTVKNPVQKKKVSTTLAQQRINELSKSLNGTYFTTDGKRAKGDSDSRCNVINVMNKNSTVRGLVKKNKRDYKHYRPSKDSLLPTHYGQDGVGGWFRYGYSCAGFANFAEWYIFSDSYADNVDCKLISKNKAFSYENMKIARPGDVVRLSGGLYSGHSAIVISVGKSSIRVLDANTWDNSKDSHASKVRVHTVNYKDISRVSISRATNY